MLFPSECTLSSKMKSSLFGRKSGDSVAPRSLIYGILEKSRPAYSWDSRRPGGDERFLLWAEMQEIGQPHGSGDMSRYVSNQVESVVAN